MDNHRLGDEITDKARAKQSNTIWPDTLRNTPSVDRLLWHGSPDATLVQRIGSLIFGLAFFSIGLAFSYWWTWRHLVLTLLLGLLMILLGIRVCFRAFWPTRFLGKRHQR